MVAGYRPVEFSQQNALLTSFARGKRFIIICGALGLLCLLWTIRLAFPSTTSIIPSQPSTPPEVSKPKNVAAIIETRPMSNLIPLILHFSSVLGSDWPIAFFTDLKPSDFKPHSSSLERAITQGRITLHPLPKDQVFSNHDTVSEFLTQPWFWEQLAPAQHVLVFQADSIICGNSPTHMDDYLQYDFIGAPIDPNLGKGDVGMNGGLSLRNRTMVLDIIAKHSWKEELANTPNPTPNEQYEDQWLYQKMLKWPGAKMPTPEEAKRFSVESMWYETPLGYHQIARWNMGHEKEIEQYCPEYKMATGVFITD